MPLILVVTKDDRIPGRVREALGPEGWSIAHVRGVTEAMQEVASEAPDLFLVASELEGAGNVLSSFARRQGGPGTIALLADEAPEPDALSGSLPGLGADAGLTRTFDPGQLRDAVERILRTGDRPPGTAAEGPKLTSREIFGDLVAEVESDARGFPGPPAPAGGGADREEPHGSGARSGPAAGTPDRRRRSDDDEIERKLEETLSGVLGRGAGPKPPPTPPRPASPPDAPGRSRRQDDDVDRLISETLSGLELPGPRKKKPVPPRPTPPAEPDATREGPEAPPPEPPKASPPSGRSDPAEFGLDDFQALLDRPRRPARPPSGRSEEPVPPPAEPPASGVPPTQPPASEPPAAAASARPPDEPPFRPRFADAMEEVPDEAAVVEEGAEAPEGAAEPGTRFGQYHLLERIGVGGMAEVWKARMTGVEGFQKTVAIKRILPHLTDSSDFVDMFVDEAKLAAQLNHANIIHIYDLGKMGDDYYIAMEYVEGENLRRILERARERARSLPVGLALHVAARLASALDHAHKKRDFEDRDLGLVHRDVSPQNVLVGYEGTIKLCDFGIVKAVSKSSHTQRGALKGKLQYMSPEQAWGRTVDGRSDIFSVGALLFEMLTGRRLFVGESEMEVLEAVRECRVVPPSELEPGVPEVVDAVVLVALEREPDDRFQSAGELGRRLEELLGAMRPTPGQTELAAYMAELFDRTPAAAEEASPVPPAAPAAVDLPLRDRAEEAAAPPEGPGEEGIAAVDEEAAVDPEAAAPAAPEAGEPEPAVAGAVEEPASGPPAVHAVEPAGRVEPEEGGRRGLWLLVAAVLAALLLGGVLAWYFVAGPGAAREAGAVQPPVEAEAGPEGVPPGDAPTEPEELETAGTVAEGGQGQEPGRVEDGEPVEEAEGGQDLPRDIEEQLAQREEALRRQFEAELSARERELQDRLSELQEDESDEAVPEAASEPPPPPEPQAPPPSAPPAPDAAGGGPGAGGETPEPAVEEVSAPEEPPPPPAEPAPSPEPAPPPPAPRPAPPPEPPAEPKVREGDLVPLGPGVTPPKLVRFEKPEYPPIARRLRAEGVVVVSVLVDETGKVIDTRVVQRASKEVGLEEAALEAARSAVYRPATKDGVRVKIWTTLRIPFRL